MIVSRREPVGSGCNTSSNSGDAGPAPRIVIYHPATLCAEALEAVVRKHTRWHVVCATTHANVATASVVAYGAQALLFEVHRGTAVDAKALIGRMRIGCPKTSLVLLTGHDGLALLRAAAAANLSAIVHMGDGVDTVQAALAAVEQGCRYRSPRIEERLDRANLAGTGPGLPGRARAARLRPRTMPTPANAAWVLE
jgi:DNA-binding NarL/FixJ family response regulator